MILSEEQVRRIRENATRKWHYGTGKRLILDYRHQTENGQLEERIRLCMADYERRAVAAAEAHAWRAARLREVGRGVLALPAGERTDAPVARKTG